MNALQNNVLEWMHDQMICPICTSVSFGVEECGFLNTTTNPYVMMVLEFGGTGLAMKQYPAMVSIEDSVGNMLAIAENDGDHVRIAERLFNYLGNSGMESLIGLDSLDMIERIIYKLMIGDICLLRGD
jgi:hypothetical protein